MRCVERGPDPRERAQGEVVPHEAVDVAGERTREAQEADGDDRHREGEDRRPLGGAGDEVAGRRHQRDAEGHRERPEEDGERHPPRGDARRGRRAGGAGASRRLQGVLDEPPAVSATTRSARRASSGRWAIRRIVHRSRIRSIASPTSSALAGSRFAVGSSRIRSGASRRKARASASRLASPADSSRPPSPTIVLVARGELPDEAVGAGELRGLPHATRRRPSGRRGGCCAAIVPRKSVGRCGTQAMCVLQAAASQDCEVDGSREQAAGVRARPGGGGARRACSCRRRSRPTRATVSPGRSSRSTPSRTGRSRPGYENETASSRTGTTRGLGGVACPAARGGPSSSRSRRRPETASPSALAWYCAARFRSGR